MAAGPFGIFYCFSLWMMDASCRYTRWDDPSAAQYFDSVIFERKIIPKTPFSHVLLPYGRSPFPCFFLLPDSYSMLLLLPKLLQHASSYSIPFPWSFHPSHRFSFRPTSPVCGKLCRSCCWSSRLHPSVAGAVGIHSLLSALIPTVAVGILLANWNPTKEPSFWRVPVQEQWRHFLVG